MHTDIRLPHVKTVDLPRRRSAISRREQVTASNADRRACIGASSLNKVIASMCSGTAPGAKMPRCLLSEGLALPIGCR